ncbi:ubiquitin interaction domain-containing protein [Drechmeria coniospora]|uniref:Ubiquitin interaction domain-containing protein n=1 Tax=Drechmeria coniospora TaxID=98403 RepID=A0A151GFG0_DRECN|nr:ubiquitin interaction domain-containing protein [Drechmeria coniospora]KYK55824.1 ubiquitin interaction domain-containing protein [Drechmeria coniospora]
MSKSVPKSSELGGADGHDEAPARSEESHIQHQRTESSKNTEKAPFSLLSLDRKKMEEERLARKRNRSAVSDDDVVEIEAPSKQRQRLVPSPPESISATRKPDAASAIPYPNGVMKRTWAYGYPRTSDDIKIEEVLQKDKLLLALLSSFQWDEEWIMSKLDMSKTKLLLAAFAADDRQARTTHNPYCVEQNSSCDRRKQCAPTCHLAFASASRPCTALGLCTPNCKFLSIKTTCVSWCLPMVFLMDLPRREASVDHKRTTFSLQLERFLRAMGVDSSMVDSLANYDFSRTVDLGFVYSIPGGHMDRSLQRIGLWHCPSMWINEGSLTDTRGYCGLGTTVAALGLATKDPVEVDFVVSDVDPRSLNWLTGRTVQANADQQCASLGSIKHDLVEAIYNACQGDDGTKEYNARMKRKPSDKQSSPSTPFKDRFRIYFPSNQTVCDSRGGRNAGGTICVQEKWWRLPTFPTELVCDCVSTRKGLLMHTKVIFVRRAKREKALAENSGPASWAGWAYVGSANLSESAWGRMVKDKATGNLKMNCRNWECGVVIPVRPSSQKADGGETETVDLGVFQSTVPVPMHVPGRAYGLKEEPWFYSSNAGST